MKRRSMVVAAAAMTMALAAAGCSRGGGGVMPPVGGGGGEVPGGGGGGPVAPPSGGSFQQGGAPSASSVTRNGSFQVSTERLRGTGSFAGGTLYVPRGVSGKVGGIFLIPPFMINESALTPYARFYASHGFAVVTMNARTTMDFPPMRASQARDGLPLLKNHSAVDSSRIAVGGYSMGGGATLEVTAADPSFKAAVPMVPWHSTKSFSRSQVPTMILSAQRDTVAAVGSHANRFYSSLGNIPKGIAEEAGASHFVPSTPTSGHKQAALAWVKYFVDGDTRYKQFITRPGGLSKWELSGV